MANGGRNLENGRDHYFLYPSLDIHPCHTYLTQRLTRDPQPYFDDCLVPLTVRHLLVECPSLIVLRHRYLYRFRGFGMIKEGLGGWAFYGREEPQSFMTDNCHAKRKGLAKTWPTSRRFLCTFNILQQIWRWLLDSKHGIQKHNRQELMATAKSLVYAKSRHEFLQLPI
ncbi:hypothetical protein E2C01_085018 [Portunus trituberculatus]|uniref:Uncharacterized protein n=1 Tax=Portunus trituberculatus TaxID=210409 RepID=A0A5B7IWU9_PORTR|nr:hypothetical protein [Portunus trituberculatus]